MRLFIAVNLPEEIQERVKDVIQDLVKVISGKIGDVKWVKPEQVHFTLKFLGDCFEDNLPDIRNALDAALAGVSSFRVRIHGLGAFPENGPPRIIWLGLQEGGDALADVAGRIERAFEGLGFPLETRPFSAHLTLGRVKRVQNSHAFQALLAKPSELDIGSMTVDVVDLMLSELSSQGPTYRILHSAPLR